MPRYIYKAMDINSPELGPQTGSVVCETEQDLAANLSLMDLKLINFKIENPDANPEPAEFVEPLLSDISHSPNAVERADDPTPDVPNARPYAPDRPRPRGISQAMMQHPQQQQAMQQRPPVPQQFQPPPEQETFYTDNDVKYMVKGGKLFKEDWMPCEKTRYRVVKINKDGSRGNNITENVNIEKLDYKELSR